MMKDPEEAIEKVLEGLRSTSAPVGMDRRIMDALEARTSARSRWGWHGWTLASVHPGATGFMKWSVGLAVVCAVVLTVTADRWLKHVDSSSKRIASSVATLPVVTSGAATNSSQVTLLRPGVRRMKASNREREVRVGEAGVADDSDSLALEEMRAASHPPPPMPLTDQEKLLLRIARKGDPVEVAELNPIVRAARYEEEKAEVQRFFRSTTQGDNE
jgi:hypothetical protein